jgi:hypothetical protein
MLYSLIERLLLMKLSMERMHYPLYYKVEFRLSIRCLSDILHKSHLGILEGQMDTLNFLSKAHSSLSYCRWDNLGLCILMKKCIQRKYYYLNRQRYFQNIQSYIYNQYRVQQCIMGRDLCRMSLQYTLRNYKLGHKQVDHYHNQSL